MTTTAHAVNPAPTPGRTARPRRTLAAAAGAVGVAAVALGLPFDQGTPSPLAPAAYAQQDGDERYRVDNVHSMVVFKIMHAGVAFNYGRFNEIRGEFNIDVEDPSSSELSVQVRAESIDTGNESRDDHLRSPDFFNAGEFPVIAFEAESFEKKDDETVVATGELSLLGQTKTMEIEIRKTGEGDVGRGYKQGMHATFTIERSEFGMTKYMDGSIGDEVTLMVSLEGNRL